MLVKILFWSLLTYYSNQKHEWNTLHRNLSDIEVSGQVSNPYPILYLPGFSSSCAYDWFRHNDIKLATGKDVICYDSAFY